MMAAEQSHPDSVLPQPASSTPKNSSMSWRAWLALTCRNTAPTFLLALSVRDGVLWYRDGGGDTRVDDGGFGAVPASGVAIAGLPETTAGESEASGEECAACLEGYEAGGTLKTMPCSHDFHERCIFGWLRVSRLCPLCRFVLPADSETEEEEEADDHDDDGEEEPSASASFFLMIE
ncbi:LOW QUALITY PROTEIN: uncharacterized protein LOC133887254 [Phragmites australis]|uniref:LOW QUALITY PROTEIN: uncharacterized protein LOC133887254 n=1 Tax=Phragmites australis TaxID=29695 RepID=UPI002D787C04|nr:LOW QUALITY PROTEIN: uncharacterized protein LOC133887254 [Phragmites australis]